MTEEKTLYPDAVPDCYGQSVKVGDTVTLTTQHPHNGKCGIYRGVGQIAIGWGCLVQFEDGGGCYVFKANQWRKVRE